MIKVPGATPDYQESVRKAKDILIRLKKGKVMLDEAVRKNEFVNAQRIINHWNKVANEAFMELEIATLLHQHILTGNTVVIRPNGKGVKVEDLAKTMDTIEMDPWLLISMEKLKAVFGDELHDMLEIKIEGENKE